MTKVAMVRIAGLAGRDNRPCLRRTLWRPEISCINIIGSMERTFGVMIQICKGLSKRSEIVRVSNEYGHAKLDDIGVARH